jgi:hypothetical protein
MLLRNAKKRAAQKGLPFSLVPEDVFVPVFCPVLGIKLQFSGPKMDPSNATIDRIIPEIGYVRENIAVISWRANCLKRDATLSELESVAAWMRATVRKDK